MGWYWLAQRAWGKRGWRARRCGWRPYGGMATRWAVATVVARELPLGALDGLLGELEGDQLRLVQRAGASLVAGHGQAWVVIGVDDAHLLDRVSALLVQQMVIRQQAAVVVTVRTGEPAPDAVTALWKDGLLDRLELRPDRRDWFRRDGHRE